jgi:hypothetical protein
VRSGKKAAGSIESAARQTDHEKVRLVDHIIVTRQLHGIADAADFDALPPPVSIPGRM